MNARRGALLGVAGLVVVALLALAARPDPSPLERALQRVGDDARFTTSAKAGQTVADISVDLRRDGTRCRAQDNGPACAALLSGAAFTAVTAVSLLDCTAPDVHDTRVALAQYLRRLQAYVDRGAGAAPTLPEVNRC